MFTVSVTGDWSAWSEWVGCTDLCSDEPVYKTRFRSCNSPEPKPSRKDGGSGCQGNSLERKMCEDIPPCPGWSDWAKLTDVHCKCVFSSLVFLLL